jgi:tetratricopeptide (TPR) repeat protein
MQRSAQPLSPTTNSADAARHLAAGIQSFNHWRLDVMDHVDAALAADPDFPMAHILKGLAMAGGRSAAYQPIVDAAYAAAKPFAADINPHERLYLEALAYLKDQRQTETAACYETIVAAHPTDLLAHRLVQQELFWMGEADWMRGLVERAAPAWAEDLPDYPLFLSVRSFSNEEAGHYEAAERYGRQAVEADPTDPWGAHAVAHVLIMQGRIGDGIDWLEPLTGNWAGKNQIVHHLWWHLCLFLLEQGAHDRILALYDEEVRNPDSPLVQAVPDAYIDVQNAAALLLRLELRGVDVGDRWQPMDDVAQGRIDNHQSPFTSAHAAIILAAAGNDKAAQSLIDSMEDYAAAAPGPLGLAFESAAIPASRAAIAHRRGDDETVIAQLMPYRRRLWLMGGSHAQRDIFFQVLVDSCRRQGRGDLLRILMEEIGEIGFHGVDQRTLYGEAARLAHA